MLLPWSSTRAAFEVLYALSETAPGLARPLPGFPVLSVLLYGDGRACAASTTRFDEMKVDT
jgi:hypothetical protein